MSKSVNGYRAILSTMLIASIDMVASVYGQSAESKKKKKPQATAEAGEALGQLAADGAAAQHQQALRQLVELPQIVRRQVIDPLQPRKRRDQGTRSGSDNNILCSQSIAIYFYSIR